jgi:hypothetical protein
MSLSLPDEVAGLPQYRTADGHARPVDDEVHADVLVETSDTAINAAAINADVADVQETLLQRKLAEAENAKLAGNDCFKRGQLLAKHTAGKQNLTQSCVHYTKALEILDKLDMKEEPAVIDLRASVFLNLAMVSLKFESWDTVINCCNEVLKMKSENSKALFRRALAHWGEGDMETAKADMELAASAAPKDKMIRSKLAELKKIVKAKGEQAVDEKSSQVVKGGETKGYHWGQTLPELHLYIALPEGVTSAKQVCCSIHRQSFSLKVKKGDGGEGAGVVDGMVTVKEAKWRYPVKADDCIWTLEESVGATSGSMHFHVHVQKEPKLPTEADDDVAPQAKFSEEEGGRYWDCVFEGDATIDIANLEQEQVLQQGMRNHHLDAFREVRAQTLSKLKSSAGCILLHAFHSMPSTSNDFHERALIFFGCFVPI